MVGGCEALSPELWIYIFSLAVDEAIISQPHLPTVFAESAWAVSPITDEWTLRTPIEAMNILQRKSYFTKKSIAATCRSFRRLAAEFLFQVLFFDDCNLMRSLSLSMDSEKELGWWTKRIHLTRFYAGRNETIEDMENALASIIRHCPNLEVFVIDWSLGNALGGVADALSTSCAHSLQTVHWNIPAESLNKVIWALGCLPALVNVHLEFDAPPDDVVSLGAANKITLSLPRLQHLALHKFFQDFLEQAAGWYMPLLTVLAFDTGASRTDQPDALTFLLHHGQKLQFLDLNCIPPINVPQVLALCPNLHTFSFNLDWRLPVVEGDEGVSMLANVPHPNIVQIGCHGLLYAFGVGYAATYAGIDPLRSQLVRRTNDRNFAALNKHNFPALQSVRVLSRTVLNDLNVADGPEEKCLERWDRWWLHCTSQGVSLEDCTGAQLGTLPDLIEDEWDEDDSEDYTEEEENQLQVGALQPTNVNELRQLLEECRLMDEDRSLAPIVPDIEISQFGQ